MAFQPYFIRLSEYNRWANTRLYATARALPDEEYRLDRGMYFQSVHGTLNHIVVGDRLWLCRITGEGECPQDLGAAPFDSFEDLWTERQRMDQHIIDLVSLFSEEDFAADLTYTDTKGVQMQKPFSVIWGHFFNHQTHHRGQIHSAISQAGQEPPELDLTYFVDEQMAKAA